MIHQSGSTIRPLIPPQINLLIIEKQSPVVTQKEADVNSIELGWECVGGWGGVGHNEPWCG